MKRGYQYNYSKRGRRVADVKSRLQKARRLIKLVAYHLKDKKISDLRLLNLGCALGIIDLRLAKDFKKVVGIDIDKDAVTYAKKNHKRKNLTFNYGDGTHLKYRDNSFDVITCMHIYEHVPNDRKLFKQIYRVLKPGGICYLAAANKLWPMEPHYRLPFLSWLPKKLGDQYVRLTGRGKSYYESLRTYWGLKKITGDFVVFDYTDKVLSSPSVFGFDDILPKGSLKATIAKIISPLATYFAPTFFWILEKEI